jgi:hypothetical protein
MNVAAVRRWWDRPAAPLLVIAAVKFVIHLATNGVYGFQRDEMYYGPHAGFGRQPGGRYADPRLHESAGVHHCNLALPSQLQLIRR